MKFQYIREKYPGTGAGPSQRPLGAFLLGGLNSSYASLSSAEVIGFDNCSVPDLPEGRHHHGSFITKWGSLAVCGGLWDGKPTSSDCLVLNSTSKQWERGILGDVLGDYVLGVVTMDVGTFMVHPWSSSFLPSGDHDWLAGPNPPRRVQCATGISLGSFLAFGSKSVSQFDSSIAGPSSDNGWVADGEWPNLQVERYGPACATLGDLTVVAGGHNELWETLKSVEIIFLTSKSLGRAEDMNKPRDHFKLIVLRTTLLAIGGDDEESMEIWEGEGERWQEAPMSLTKSRSHFSALATTDLVCSDGPLPSHSCPTVDEDTCAFPFTNGRKSMMTKCNFVIVLRINHVFFLCQWP